MINSVVSVDTGIPSPSIERASIERAFTDHATTDALEVQRPGLLRWLLYAFGAGLPAEFDGWVFRDTTGRGWVLRQLGRSVVQLAPLVVAVLVFIPGAFWIRGVAVIAATAMALLFSLAYMTETTDH